MEILWKGTVPVEIGANRPKLYGKYAFPQNFHTRTLGEIMVLYTVDANGIVLVFLLLTLNIFHSLL